MSRTPPNELAEPPAAMLDALTQLMPGWQRADVRSARYLSGGYSNENYAFDYQGERYVLRLPNRRRPYVDRVRELAFLESQSPLRRPELVAFDTASGQMLTRFVSGPLLSEVEPEIRALADYLSRLHRALPPGGRRYDPTALSREFLSNSTQPAIIESLLTGFFWKPLHVTGCHNDLNPWNVILPESGPWVTLDWEWYGDNDPLFDVVTLHQGLGLNDDSLRELLPGWSRRTVGAEELRDCQIAFWLREYAWAYAEQAHGNNRPEISEQRTTALSRLDALTS
ncbi:MAG: phosphotransferase [Pseudomonadota bacterium]